MTRDEWLKQLKVGDLVLVGSSRSDVSAGIHCGIVMEIHDPQHQNSDVVYLQVDFYEPKLGFRRTYQLMSFLSSSGKGSTNCGEGGYSLLQPTQEQTVFLKENRKNCWQANKIINTLLESTEHYWRQEKDYDHE